MQELDALLRRFEGDDDVILHVPVGQRTVNLRSRSHRIDWTPDLERELLAVVGKQHVSLVEGAKVEPTIRQSA